MAIFYDARLFWMSLIHQFKCCFRHEYFKNIVRIEGRKLIHRYYPYQLNRIISWSYPLNDNIMPTLPIHLCFELVLFRYKCKDPMHGTSISYYSDVIMGAMALQITSLTIVHLSVYSGADQRKHQSSVTSLCQGNSPVTGELPIEMVSNAKNVPIWWGHNVSKVPQSSNCHWWWGLVAEWSIRKKFFRKFVAIGSPGVCCNVAMNEDAENWHPKSWFRITIPFMKLTFNRVRILLEWSIAFFFY